MTVQSRTALLAKIALLINTNGAQDITAAEFREVLGDMVDSGLLLKDVPAFGCARLTYNTTTTVKLVPVNGNLVTFPSGVNAVIPSAGITSASIASTTLNYINGAVGAALAANTLYYAYLWDSGGGNYVIDWSTTGHSTDATTGIEIKTGDVTRVLVGMIRTNAGPVIADSANARLVASWFHRRNRSLGNKFTADRATTGTGYGELHTEIRSTFVCWDQSINIAYAGGTYTASGSVAHYGGPSIDGVSAGFPATRCLASTTEQTICAAGTMAAAEGYHYLTYMAAVASGTGTWDSANQQSLLSGTVFI